LHLTKFTHLHSLAKLFHPTFNPELLGTSDTGRGTL
jgi:hypothetical protein